MPYLRDTSFHREAFQELNYDFGDYYLFETFVVAEIHKDVVFNWEEHGKVITEEISHLYEQNGKDIVYISNRINEYAIVPSDWLDFFRYSYSLKGYGIVSYNPGGRRNTILEKLFMRSKMKNFDNLTDAIQWAKELAKKKAEGKKVEL